jgi:hypothetical protein
MAEQQTYKNHTRWNWLVHFVISPLLIFHFIWVAVALYLYPSWDRAEYLLLAAVLILMSIMSRMQPITAQDRIIRLEEDLRYKVLLAPEIAEQAIALPTGKKIALRFASDKELPGLIQRVLNDELKTSKEIKLAITNWRGDHLRV